MCRRAAIVAAVAWLAVTPAGAVPQDCAARPWRCAAPPSQPPPAPPDHIGSVTLAPDFFAPMAFRDGGVEVNGRRVIYATGEVQADSGNVFAAYLEAHGTERGALVAFHSPGGSAGAGLAIGRLMRSHSLRAAVAQQGAGLVPGYSGTRPALCASACSLAFLGGVSRSIPDGSLFGVHDLALGRGGQPPPDLFDLGQKIAAEIGAYIREMGVDSRLLDVMMSQNSAANEIAYLSPEDMRILRVTTDSATTWELKNDASGFFLVGSNPESSIVPGFREQVVLQCSSSPRRVILAAYFMPEQLHLLQSSRSPLTAEDFAGQVTGLRLAGYVGDSPRVEDRYVTFDIAPPDIQREAARVDAHRVTASIIVTPRVANLLHRADVLTFGFQQRLGAPGQVSVTLADGRPQVENFLASCR